MPSSRKQINVRPQPDNYELIAAFADHWGVPKCVALERLALRGASDMAPILNGASANRIQQVSTASQQLISANPERN